VAADADELASLHLDFQPAAGFTQGADAVVGGAIGHEFLMGQSCGERIYA
jgi:hypothetical protein